MKIIILAAAALCLASLSAQADDVTVDTQTHVKTFPGVVGLLVTSFPSVEPTQAEGNGISDEASSGEARPSFAPDKGEVTIQFTPSHPEW
jgi:hypothetical protein